LTSSIGVRTYDVHAPEIPPATTRPERERSPDGVRKSLDDLKKSCARLYVKNKVAFSAMAPKRGDERP